MKVVICALLVAFAYAGTVLPLSGLATAPVNPAVTLTATYPIASPNVVLTAFSGISTYTAGATPAAIGAVSATITWTNTNQTISQFIVSYGTGINTNVVSFSSQASTTTGGVTTTVYTNPGTTQTFRFNAAATYPVSISAYSSVGYAFTSLSPPAGSTGTSLVVTGSYTEPALGTFNMINPNGCTSTGCTAAPNATATITPVLNWSLGAYFRATTATQAGVFGTSASCDATSLCNFDSVFATAWTGSFGSVTALGYAAGFTLTAGSTLVPQGASAVGSGFILDPRNFWGTPVSEATFLTKQAAITFPVGSTDVISPVCTSAIFAPATVTSVNVPVSSTLTITCTDAVSVYRKGVFATATPTGASNGIPATTFGYSQPGSSASADVFFPAYVSGTLQIVGVWAVDSSLNSALYGSCGNTVGVGYTTIGCAATGGSGSSSASTVTLSVFAVFSLFVMALFA